MRDQPRIDGKFTIMRGIGEAVSLLRTAQKPKPGKRVLLYHAIGTSLDFDPRRVNTVEPAVFREQMRQLRGYEFDLFSIARQFSSECSLSQLSVSVTFDDGYRDVLTSAAPILCELGIPFTVFIVPAFIESPGLWYLDRAQLRELVAMPGVSIGSHSYTHTRLTGLPDRKVADELSRSKSWLEDFLGTPVTTVAYPFGGVDERVRAIAKEQGYHLGFSTRFGINGRAYDPLTLFRTEVVGRDGLRTFDQKVCGGWDWYSLKQRFT